GVPNCADDCPLDPFKIAPGVCGCGVVDVDCNANNVCDSIELSVPGLDTNANGKLDACEQLYGDLNLDGTVNASDFALQLAYWGAANPPIGDLEEDGDVDGADIAILLGNWGTAP
ncbi:MAG: dockerin type I domain-containing protein, partial [Planctomycetota bacterium]